MTSFIQTKSLSTSYLNFVMNSMNSFSRLVTTVYSSLHRQINNRNIMFQLIESEVMIMNIYQEAMALSSASNLIPARMFLRLPERKEDVSVYLLSDSFEYDIRIVKMLPAPKVNYHMMVMPYRIFDKICGIRPLRFQMTQNDIANKVRYINDQRLLPKLEIIRYPYPKTLKSNLYIPMSEVFKQVSTILRTLPKRVIQEQIFDMFMHTLNYFNFSTEKVLVVDTSRYKLYNQLSVNTYNSDLLNALLTALLFNNENAIKRLKLTIIFRSPKADYKLDLMQFNPKNDALRLRKFLNEVGIPLEMTAKTNEEAGESVDDFESDDEETIAQKLDRLSEPDTDEEVDIETAETETREIKTLQQNNTDATTSITATIDTLKTKYGEGEAVENPNVDKNNIYNAKVMNINARLMNRINPATNIINNYGKIADELNTDENNSIEKKLNDDTAKKLAKDVDAANVGNATKTITSARELKIRENLGKIKLNNVSFNTITSITDTPLPKPMIPNNITTLNVGARKGTKFAKIESEYEDKLMDRDIVSTFMQLSKLPDGFYVTDVKVTDVSDATSLVHNWRVTLKNRQTDRTSNINIRVPVVKNGKFYLQGIWYNIGKQDFPIPILKIDPKTVMLTSNYNKITVSRYDTKSLVDVGLLIKVMKNKTQYIKPGSSVSSNRAFVSTIEYDEYAKQWFCFINKQANCEIYFNRTECAKRYTFVDVKPDEFCCGMLNKVPIVINTETGLTRNGITLTETIVNTLPPEVQREYRGSKPGKLSMYSECKLDAIKLPVGLAACAWEGLTNVLKKLGIKYQFVDNRFDDHSYFILRFKDKSLAIANTIPNQLLFNGFYRINTRAYNSSDFETPIMNSNSIYVDIFNQLFFKQYSQLTTFITYYQFFVDVITSDVCLHYNLPNDIVGMLAYASNLLADNNCGSETNSALYRIRSSEIIPAIIHYRLAFAISRYNNNMGSKVRGNPLQFNPNEVINELLSVPNVEPSSALNPFVELHSKENITKKGFKGVNNDRAYKLIKRAYDPSMIGKMALSSPNNGNIGINRQITVNPKLESVRGYTTTEADINKMTDLDLSSYSELLTPASVTRDDAIRTAIATSQTSHIMATDESEPVMISNGVDEILPGSLSDEFSVMAKEDGVVIDKDDQYLIVQYKSGKKEAVPISDRYSFNSGSGFYVDNKLITALNVKDKFKQNDILAYHSKFFTKGIDGVVRANIGPIAKVAFMGTYATYEDAGVMTEKMSKRMTSHVTMMQDIKIDADAEIDFIVKVGDEIEVGDPLVIFGIGDTGDKNVNNFLKAFQPKDGSQQSLIDNAKRVKKAKHSGRVVDVRIYTIKSMDKLSPSLYQIVNNYFNENKKKRRILDKYDKTNSVYKMNTLFSLPTEPLKSASIKGITADVLVEVYIDHPNSTSVGDKCVCYAASKQVISEMIPEGLEPYSEKKPDEEISMFVSSGSILKRMIPSVMIVAAGNKVLKELKERIRGIWEG